MSQKAVGLEVLSTGILLNRVFQTSTKHFVLIVTEQKVNLGSALIQLANKSKIVVDKPDSICYTVSRLEDI